MSGFFASWIERLAALQTRRPWIPLLVCVAVAALATMRAEKLELRTRFEQLLPDSQPSVVELRRVSERTSNATSIYVVLEGDDTKELRAFGDALLPKLRALGPESVTSAADGVQISRAFLMQRAALFQTPEELEKLRHDVDARWDYEVAKENGELLDEDETPPPPLTAAELRKRFEGKHEADELQYPDGYFQSKDGKALVVLVATPIAAGDLSKQEAVLERVKKVVAEAHAGPFANVRVGYAGDLVTGLAEYGAVKEDLVQVGIMGVGLVLVVIFLFYVRVRALVAMGCTILLGLAWTFGLTAITIGHLNVATGFLFSIVAGNGINAGIIWLQRFYEERRAGKTLSESIVVAQRNTWVATLVIAVAAAASYSSMLVTDFRAFKHFAIIGASGMFFCWVAKVVALPAIVCILHREAPAPPLREGAGLLARLRWTGVPFQAPFVALVRTAPRGLALLGAAFAVSGVVLGVLYVRSDPMEYNMRRLQNDLGGGAEMYRVSKIAEQILGAKIESSMVVLTDRLDQVKPLEQTLEARRDAAPPGDKPLEAVHTIYDFVPDEQAKKLPDFEALAERMKRAHERGIIKDEDWKELSQYVPPDPEDVKPFGVKDLPEELARPFTEKDGTRGRLVLVEPTAGKNDSDLRYLLKYANAFRETKLPDGSVVRGSGRAVIFADMLAAVQADMPKAITLAFVLTLLSVALSFRRGAYSIAVVGSLLMGLAMLAAVLALGKVKINFFNFIALPITFGIGVDYAVNLMHRYVVDGKDRQVLHAMETTGGAIVLCSLTTIVGYLALIGSMNQAIRSLGIVAVAGELTCLGSAMLVLAGAVRSRELTRRAP